MADQVYWDDLNEGDEVPTLVKKVSTQQLVMWAAASGDFYQIHYDERFAKNNQLKGIIVHGALKCAFLGQYLHDWAGEQGAIKGYQVSYRGMDYPNQEIFCKGVITKKYEADGEHIVELDIWTETGVADGGDDRPTNEPGLKTTPGSAKVALPVRG